MKSPLFRQTATSRSSATASAEAIAFADPWQALDERGDRRENWLVSYIDILTLFLTLFVVLLALQPKNEAPPVDADPGEVRVVSPEPIDRQTAPPTLSVQAEHPQDTKNSDMLLDLPAMSETAGDNETAIDSAQTFSILDVLAEPIVPLIHPPLVKESDPIVSDPPPDATDSTSELSTAALDTNLPEEPAVDEEPADPEGSREQVRLFMEKLAQQNLEDRVRISEVAEGVYLEVSDNILFALGSAELKSDGAVLLDELAQLLFEHNGMVSIEGHTDDRPIANSRFPSNWELSSGRATTVTRYLIGKGMDPERLRAVGYADTRPLESNATVQGRARNRRVALIVEIPEI